MTSSMKDSGVDWIGKIPEEWTTEPLSTLITELSIKNIPLKTTKILSLVKDVGVMPYEEKGNAGNKAKENILDYKVAYPDTLVINSMNVLIGSVGLSKYTGCVSPVYYVFRETSKSDIRFINYIFNTREFQAELKKYAKGILEIRLRVSLKDIFRRRIATPSKDEQKSIADFLDKTCNEIDKLSTDIQSQIDKLAEYKKSIITHTVTKGLDPNVQMKDSGVDWIGKIPEEWGIAKAKYYFTNDKEAAGALADQLPRLALTLNGVVDRPKDDANGLQPKEFTGYQIFDRNDLVFKLIDLQNISTSRVGLVPKRGIMSGAYIRLIGRATISPNYSQYFYLSMWHRQIFNKLGDDGVRSSLSVSDLLNLPITAPPLDEQKRIADYLDDKCSDIDGIIKIKKKQLDKLAEYKKSIIYEYTTGKKRIKE